MSGNLVTPPGRHARRPRRARLQRSIAAAGVAAIVAATPAQASLFSGETLDFVANVLAWIVLFAAPVIAITVFWLVHILPEKIAEKRHHPQAPAIKTLCLLSLFFGGLLWPLAWLWAYSRPVLYKMAYGVDEVKHGAGQEAHMLEPAPAQPVAPVAVGVEEETELAAQTTPRANRVGAREPRPWEV